MGYALLFIVCSLFWGVLIATLIIHIKNTPKISHLLIPYPECKDGACVPATLANLFNDEFFLNFPPSPLGYDMNDAGRWVEEYSKKAFRLTTIVKFPMISHTRLLKAPIIKDTLTQFKAEYPNTSKYVLLVLSTLLPGNKRHCVGVVWDVSGVECWVVDPATSYTKNVTIKEVFQFYSVEEVGLVMMGVNVVALFPPQNLSHIVKSNKKDIPPKTPSK